MILGSDGRSGRSGSGGSAGSIGSGGSESPAENQPIERFGRSGRRIGEIRISKFGIPKMIANRISERSKIISGHFGNLITGIEGSNMDKSLNFQL